MNYDELKYILCDIKHIKIQKIGKSCDGRNIYAAFAFFSEQKKWIIIQGGMHAREHLSSDMVAYLMKQVDNNYSHYNSLTMFPNICFVPMVNPDGVQIVHFGLKAVKKRKHLCVLRQFVNKNNYFLLKSNARGVDINNNFDAFWDQNTKDEPDSFGYRGQKPFSEPETLALKHITQKLNPCFTISYHTKGEEIYYDFYQDKKRQERDEKIAKIVQNINGYSIKSTQNSSFGGYKDWCINSLKIPSLTIELGQDKYCHPMNRMEIYDIITKNARILDVLCDIVSVCEDY